MRRNDRRNRRREYAKIYDATYKMWRSILKNLALTAISWDGNPFYPELCVPERWLVEMGQCIAFEDSELGFMILPCTGSNSLNPVGFPSVYQANSQNGAVYRGLIPGVNSVLILNNPSGYPEMSVIDSYAERLTNRQVTQDVNLNVQKTPILYKVPKNLELTARNLLNEYSMGATDILTSQNFDLDAITCINVNAPFIVPELSLEMRAVYNEYLTYLGIPSMDVTKNERMLRDEIAQAMGGAIASRAVRMQSRRTAAEQIKQMFGVDMAPEYAVDSEPIPDYTPGGNGNESLYNDTWGDDIKGD